MNKRVIRIFSVIFIASIMLTGCSSSLKSENSNLKKELTDVKDKNTNLEKSVSDLQNKLKEQESKNTVVEEPSFENQNSVFTIYKGNIDTYKKEKDGYVYIDSTLTLKQKLENLTKVLSEVYFSDLPIQVVKIEEIDKKQIAVVNLSESKENQGIDSPANYKGNSWAAFYLQGSAGGQITSTKLIETILQRDYKGQWIDGVRFLYNNGVCDFEHTPDLKDVNYR